MLKNKILLSLADNIPPGEQTFTGNLNTTVSYNFVVPANVTLVSAVCIGGGASGELVGRDSAGAETGDADGGGGGNLRWKNDILVTPGETLTVTVGGGGEAITRTANATTGVSSSGSADAGFSSYISRSGTVLLAAGGAYGANVTTKTSPDSAIGVDGVGGGNGSRGENGSTSLSGSGGDAGGYLADSTSDTGKGSYLYGLDPATGLQRNVGSAYGDGGIGDSTPPAAGASDSAGDGVNGAVRIIWGTGRSFPYNAQ